MEASDKAVLGPIVNSASTLASKLCNRHRIVFKIIVAFEMAIDPREESIFLARNKCIQCMSELGVNDTQIDSIQYLNFAKK